MDSLHIGHGLGTDYLLIVPVKNLVMCTLEKLPADVGLDGHHLLSNSQCYCRPLPHSSLFLEKLKNGCLSCLEENQIEYVCAVYSLSNSVSAAGGVAMAFILMQLLYTLVL